MENDKKPLPLYFYLLIIVLLLITGAFTVLYLDPVLLAKTQASLNHTLGGLFSPSSKIVSTPPSQVTPTIPEVNGKSIPIKQGREAYSVSQGKTDGPKITKVVIDPHDPKVGVKQTITVSANHTQPITWVKITIYSDNKIETHDLSLSTGTNQNGTWSGSWTIVDTHLHTWGFSIESGDGLNQSKVGIPIR